MSTGDPKSESFAVSKLASLENRIEELEAENQKKDRQISDLERTVEALEARTDLLSLVENSDAMDGMERSIALLQHLQRKAEKEAKRGRSKSAAIDKDAAEEALHHPDIDRTTYYSDFRRCERLVGDERVCYYEGGSPARLVLNLENGDVPPKFSTNGGDGP